MRELHDRAPKVKSRRKHPRFDVSLDVSFRTTYGATEYSGGTAVNLSCGGLGLHAHDFRFILYENLELHLGVPGGHEPVYLFGDILWKRQDGKRCEAGIQFRMKDGEIQQEALQKIFAASGIAGSELYTEDGDYVPGDPGRMRRPGLPGRPAAQYADLPNKLGFIKRYHTDGTRCAVTFRLLREKAGDADTVSIVGDFNGWNASQSRMVCLENGDFVITVELESNRQYRYRYLVDGKRWEVDWYADRFVPNERGFKDSVVIV